MVRVGWEGGGGRVVGGRWVDLKGEIIKVERLWLFDATVGVGVSILSISLAGRLSCPCFFR